MTSQKVKQETRYIPKFTGKLSRARYKCNQLIQLGLMEADQVVSITSILSRETLRQTPLAKMLRQCTGQSTLTTCLRKETH